LSTGELTLIKPDERIVTTYSMWEMFRSCRKKAHLRYNENLVPLRKEAPLEFGTIIHECLRLWHLTHEIEKVTAHIEAAFLGRFPSAEVKFRRQLATAMMMGYAKRYPTEAFEVIALEHQFRGEIVNPATGASSRSFVLAGKIDGLVFMDGGHYLLEHKTAGLLDGNYLERLWTDFQITLYSHYIEQALNIKIAGVLYNILVKAKLKQSEGETEDEFEVRRAELIAKSKAGKTTAQRKLPESDDEFQSRLNVKYDDPNMFHREQLLLSRDQFRLLQEELWDLTQQYLAARRQNLWSRSTSYCFHWNRPCGYYPICTSGGNPNVIENLYEIRPPHSELAEVVEDEPTDSTPF